MDPAWLTSAAALIAAFTALLGSIAAILRQVRQLKGEKSGRTPVWAIIGIALFVFASAVIVARLVEEKKPLNVELATAAWNAFNRGDYSGAIAAADDCISHFRTTADKEEAALENGGVPVPPTGQTGTDEKERILKRGVLNDAAACFFVRGESASRLGRKDDAIEAYRQVVRYRYARVFDPSGNFFWAPSEVAEGRLTDLQK
jgi:hypothetical protein